MINIYTTQLFMRSQGWEDYYLFPPSISIKHAVCFRERISIIVMNITRKRKFIHTNMQVDKCFRETCFLSLAISTSIDAFGIYNILSYLYGIPIIQYQMGSLYFRSIFNIKALYHVSICLLYTSDAADE